MSEVKVYVGKVIDDYFQTVAMVDIGKVKYESATLALYKERNGIPVFLWVRGAEMWEDHYGNTLVAIDADVALIALYDDSVKYKCPTLLYTALMALRTIAKHYPDTKVVLYGY